MDDASDVSPGEKGRLYRALRTGLMALLVYLNVAAINAQFAANFPGIPALPVIDLLVDPFFLSGMFNGYERDASELTIQGLFPNGWRALARHELLPGPSSEYAIWAQASRSLGELLPKSVILKERARFLERMRERHNRLHPSAPIARLRVGVLHWPKSRLGHDAERERGQETFTVLYEN